MIPAGVCRACTSTALNDFSGTESIEDGAREVVRVALLGPAGPTGTFARWEDATIPLVARLSRPARRRR